MTDTVKIIGGSPASPNPAPSPLPVDLTSAISAARDYALQAQAGEAEIVAALSDKQPRDAVLTALSGLEHDADELIYSTGRDSFATTPFTAFGRSLVGAPDEAGAGLLIGAIVDGGNF